MLLHSGLRHKTLVTEKAFKFLSDTGYKIVRHSCGMRREHALWLGARRFSPSILTSLSSSLLGLVLTCTFCLVPNNFPHFKHSNLHNFHTTSTLALAIQHTVVRPLVSFDS